MKKVKILLLAVFLSACCSLLIAPGKAQASDADILKKWVKINAYDCIAEKGMLLSPAEMRNSNGDVKSAIIFDEIIKFSTDGVLTPSYGFGGTTPGNAVVCDRVLRGTTSQYNGLTNLLTYGGMGNLAKIKWNDSNPANVEKLMTALDYVGEETADGGGRFSIQAHRSGTSCMYGTFSTTCSDIDGESTTVGITVTRQSDGLLLYERDSGNFWNDLKVSFKDHNLILETATGVCSGGGKLEEPLQNDLNTMYDNLKKSLTNTTWTVTCMITSTSGMFATTHETVTNYTFGVTDKVVNSSEISRYVLKDQPAGVANNVNRAMMGSSFRGFTSTEQYQLYDFYLNKAIAANGAAANRKTCNPTDTTGLEAVKLLDTSDNTFKTCYVNFNKVDPATIKVNAPNDSYTKIIEISMRDVINRLNNLSTGDIDIAAITGVGASNDPYAQLPGSGGNEEGEEDGVYPCLEAAESLGWVLCPVLDFLGRAIDKIYSYVEDSFLVVDAGMLSGDTYDAWKSFRNFANTIFIIAFLIVILSQVTGFGVSNYGIKKLLPRLIALAILVNVSFIICQLAVDISNIVGANIKTLLSNLSSVHLDGEISAGGIAAEILSVLGLGAAGALAPSVAAIIASSLATGTAGYWLLMILVTFLGFLISILFAGILLAVRQAGVILLVVLSPVAIVCYALPNTKPIFDKWRRIFMSLLLVYPMCGAIVGGGQFATSLLINNNGGFFYTLVAMLLSVIPFFFIPTLVRSSLNGIGQLGARLSNFGRGMSRGLTGAIRGSERFKDAQRELGLRRDEATVQRLDAMRANGKKLTAAQQRRRARAYARADKGRREDLIGESYNGRGLLRYDDEKQAQLMANLETKDFEERVSGAKAAYRNDPGMATEKNIIAEHNRLLSEFGRNPNDTRLQSQLRALEEMAMEKGAPGQDMLQQSFARYMARNKNSWNGDKAQAISKLSAGLATRYGKELNGTDKGFNVAMNDFAGGDFSKLSSFSGSDRDGYRSSYDTKLAGFTAAGMNKATPGALERGFAALKAGEYDADKALTMVGNATQALNDELIANDLKPAEKGFVQDIASYGAAMPGNSSVITSLGQGSLENLAQFVDNTSDASTLMALGQNIQDAADSSHLYGEGETSRLKMIINKINSKTGTTYTFNPASMQINQNSQNGQNNQSSQGGSGNAGSQGGGGNAGSQQGSSQQDLPDWIKVSDADRAKLQADAAKTGRRIR